MLKASRDEIIGFEIVKTALEEPFTKLLEECGIDAGQLDCKSTRNKRGSRI
jgi:chaperonin GroEL (HSP60 family)